MPKWFVISVAILGLNTIAVIGTTLVTKTFASEQPSEPSATAGSEPTADTTSVEHKVNESNRQSTPAEVEPNVPPQSLSNPPSRDSSTRYAEVQEPSATQSAANIPIPDELKVPSLGDPTQDPFFQELQALVSEQNAGLLSQSSPLDDETRGMNRAQSEEYFARLRGRLEIVSHLTAAAQGLTDEAERQSKSPVESGKAADTLRQIIQLREMIGKLVSQEL